MVVGVTLPQESCGSVALNQLLRVRKGVLRGWSCTCGLCFHVTDTTTAHRRPNGCCLVLLYDNLVWDTVSDTSNVKMTVCTCARLLAVLHDAGDSFCGDEGLLPAVCALGQSLLCAGLCRRSCSVITVVGSTLLTK